MKRLRWGIVGTGRVSEQLVSDLLSLSGAMVSAVWGRRLDRAREFADAFGIPSATDDHSALFARDDVDIVYIATPSGTHLPIALAAISAGKHILVEKPMAVTADEVDQIFDAAQRAGKFAMEAMWMKFNPMHVEVRRRIDSGGLGEPRSVRAGFGLPFPDGGSRWDADLGGSTILDQGIYPVTLAMQVLGEPTSVSAHGVCRDGVDVAAHITLEFTEGRFAHLACSMVEFVQPSAAISGTGGWVDLHPMFWAGTSASWHAGDARTIFSAPERIEPLKEGNGYTPMLRSVVCAVDAGLLEHPQHPRDSTVRVAGVLDTIRSALRVRSGKADEAAPPSHGRSAAPPPPTISSMNRSNP